jgi:5-methylcytosine-specific restriction endonuclease McrA
MTPTCQLCGRPLGTIRVEDHHLIPKTFKGRDTIPIHRICHQKIHATFSERELLNYYYTVDRLLEHEQIIKFVKWVQKRPIDFYDKNDDTAERRKRR